MKRIVLLYCLVSNSFCEVEFSSRPRNFSIELIHFTQLQTDGHVVISPFGIWTLMTGVSLGAAGRSYQQLSRAFFLPKNTKALLSGYRNLTKTTLGSTSKDVSLSSTNLVFLADDFYVKPGFQRLISAGFGAEVKSFNFKDSNSAAQVANKLIQSSNGRVGEVLSPDDFAGSRMVLTNVVSFKGLWGSPFNKSDTKIEPFFNEKGEIIGHVNMMYQKGELPVSNVKSLKAFVLEMPYGIDGKYSMLFILPYGNSKVTDMYKKLAIVSLKDIFDKLDEDLETFGLEVIDVKIPRFKISTNIILNKPLNDMGVYDIFEPQLADFRRITNEKIFVSAIVHKADIEVTESGTAASAESTAVFADRKMTRFEANKPFLYFVIEKSTTTVMFGGIYSKPTVF